MAIESTFLERFSFAPSDLSAYRCRLLLPTRAAARQFALAAAGGAGCAALVPSATVVGRISLGAIAFGVVGVAFAACAAAGRYDVAWRTERMLRAAAGGGALVVAMGAGALTLGEPLGAASAAALGIGAALAVLVAAPVREDRDLDLRDRVLDDAPHVRPGLPPLCRASKRALDVVGASVGLVLALPVLVVLAVVITMGSPGGFLFRQTRVGQHGRRFTVLKLRTMSAGNDDSYHRAYVASLIANNEPAQRGFYKITADPRITPAGRWIRKLSLDELPQLVNVLRGDMSLVGPRPPLPSETELYDERALLRLRCKPGMTGLWQVSGRSRVGFDDMVAMDIRYWREWSLRMEAGILARTARAVFAADTA